MLNFIFVGLGGFLGAIVRYLTNQCLLKLMPAPLFPYATFTVNITGCFLFGVLMGLFEQKGNIPTHISLFLLVGFLGSLTTFSNYAYESFQLIRNGYLFMAVLNVAVQTGIGLIAITLGYFLGYKGIV